MQCSVKTKTKQKPHQVLELVTTPKYFAVVAHLVQKRQSKICVLTKALVLTQLSES